MATPDYIFEPTARVLGDVLPLYRRTPGQVGDAKAYAAYRRVLDKLIADTRAAARSSSLAVDLLTITRGYREASTDMLAVIAGLERVIGAVRMFQPVTGTGVRALQRQHELALTGLVETLALAEIAAAVAIWQPGSQDQAARMRQRLARTFSAAIERASDREDVEVMHALREAQSWIIRDLTERGRPLARIVGYETGLPLPSVVLAHMLYQDAGRAGELEAENPGHDHPAFMPMLGKALSR